MALPQAAAVAAIELEDSDSSVVGARTLGDVMGVLTTDTGAVGPAVGPAPARAVAVVSRPLLTAARRGVACHALLDANRTGYHTPQ